MPPSRLSRPAPPPDPDKYFLFELQIGNLDTATGSVPLRGIFYEDPGDEILPANALGEKVKLLVFVLSRVRCLQNNIAHGRTHNTVLLSAQGYYYNGRGEKRIERFEKNVDEEPAFSQWLENLAINGGKGVFHVGVVEL